MPVRLAMRTNISFTSQTEQTFINQSKALIQMGAYERMKFLTVHDDISKKDKINVLDTFISLLEKIEDFEACESLLDLKKQLMKTKQLEN